MVNIVSLASYYHQPKTHRSRPPTRDPPVFTPTMRCSWIVHPYEWRSGTSDGLFLPLCRTTKSTVALHHRTGATSSPPSSIAPGGPPTTSAAATDVPYRHRLPLHQVCFTDVVSHLTWATSPSTSSHLYPLPPPPEVIGASPTVSSTAS